MNLKEFMVLVKGLNAEAEDTLDVANKEYATEESKFNNFELTAAILREMNPRLKDIEPEDIALIFMMKHLFSIAAGVSLREDMRGRYKDCLNYIHLHHGIWHEKRQVNNVPQKIKDMVVEPVPSIHKFPSPEEDEAFPKRPFLTNNPDNVFYSAAPEAVEEWREKHNGNATV